MSFNGFKSLIKEGDLVIVYLTASQFYTVHAKPQIVSKKGSLVDNVIQTPYGSIRCEELIGKEYGTRIVLSKGWVHILQPTPELWTLSLPHRTQIIYTPDISMIILQLEISPGSTVVESGTGSGSLSHALIRTVKPHGRLYTFDFHEERTRLAGEEFIEHGLGEFATVSCRDVCATGFGDQLDGKADAVFLDLPHPWLAIPHAVKCFGESGGRICSFSPCIEQVQKSCSTLAGLGFSEIESMEVLQTQYAVIKRTAHSLDLSFLRHKKDDAEDGAKNTREAVKTLVALPPQIQPGHTGFLTFATLPPVWCRNL